ncbi:hypothetical protein [Stutzerimonas kirkiae]|uniref:Uncharacterized protein n=1 Tax=Stutzerimonas kirkiae TaxID=2211392 RepID=A0A4Q9RDP0_9GAMM|nr:hypothetical protein [Stutzerimonas kirkiae]TBU99826.1 hypothetical protein DNJ96_00560 [Stutzerimonas kirkiae]TBV05242.1 hypothetical protein DNJ95_03235 [Stutzerimonas kirkiae]TBV08143.1 hypothetical protein DNK08_11440 [Stutzerimonas kirkiae]TBV17600.1 hypothetical protein DNK01_01765 [Stutzerimonas kirkiae]
MSRAHFHQEHASQAAKEALRLYRHKDELGPHWLSWVATELYRMSPPPYAAMVRRELERLQKQP